MMTLDRARSYVQFNRITDLKNLRINYSRNAHYNSRTIKNYNSTDDLQSIKNIEQALSEKGIKYDN